MGMASLPIGAAELSYERTIKRRLGLPMPTSFMRAFGTCELLAGFTALAHPDRAGPMGMRVAGDAFDLAVLGVALLPGNRRRWMVALAMIGVMAMTVPDLAAAAGQARREAPTLRTARRTRVKVIEV